MKLYTREPRNTPFAVEAEGVALWFVPLSSGKCRRASPEKTELVLSQLNKTAATLLAANAPLRFMPLTFLLWQKVRQCVPDAPYAGSSEISFETMFFERLFWMGKRRNHSQELLETQVFLDYSVTLMISAGVPLTKLVSVNWFCVYLAVA